MKPNKMEVENNNNNNIFSLFIDRLTLGVLLIIFVWAFSITIFSSSDVHICVSSRKLTNLYCISAGSEPAFYTIPLPLISNVSQVSISEDQAGGVHNVTNESKKQLECDGKGVYVYELPSKFNKDLLSHCQDMISNGLDFCQFLRNDGLGEPVLELGKDWYNTNQYSLELIFHSRVLNHPCRVQNPEEANLFYVPFYGGLDHLRWRFKDVSNQVRDSLSLELVQWLKKQNTWVRNHGLDHVFVLGKNSWNFRRFHKQSWGTHLLKLDEHHHPWNINDVGVPHPTYFHPSSDQDMEEWQSKVRKVERKNLISFAGAPYKPFDNIRSILIKQCTSESENTCNFFDCSQNACVSPTPLINLFMESEFCLLPDTDSSGLKSLFDSIISGCIPVVFDPFMVSDDQYPWHLSMDYKKYTVYIDEEEVRTSQVNVIERLAQIPLKERQEMRKYIIHELMPKLVYSNPNGTLQKFQDAFDIAMNHLLERVIERLASS